MQILRPNEDTQKGDAGTLQMMNTKEYSKLYDYCSFMQMKRLLI